MVLKGDEYEMQGLVESGQVSEGDLHILGPLIRGMEWGLFLHSEEYDIFMTIC